MPLSLQRSSRRNICTLEQLQGQAMRIGELARATGTKAETIRSYEREGILTAADRTDSDYRDYSDEHLATLTFVRPARELGFSMAQVREQLAVSAPDDNPCADCDNSGIGKASCRERRE